MTTGDSKKENDKMSNPFDVLNSNNIEVRNVNKDVPNNTNMVIKIINNRVVAAPVDDDVRSNGT